MRTSIFHALGLTALALGTAGALGYAQIKELSLPEMVEACDDAVYGEIVGSHVFRVDHPSDGDQLYFTTLTIEGRLLGDGSPITVDVTHHGGFIGEEEGVYNSEAPSRDDTRLGNRVVVFYDWTNNMGGGVAANAIVASHGGLYRTLNGPKGPIVMGRGTGYALETNLRLTHLERAVGDLLKAKKNR